MTRSRSVSPTGPGNGQGHSRTPYEARDRSVSPTTHQHAQMQRSSYEARQSSQHRSPSRTTAGRNRSNPRGTPVTTSPSRGRPVGPQAPPSIFSHSGPYYLRRSNSDNQLSHNFKKKDNSGNPDTLMGSAGWSSAVATITAAAKFKPAVLPPSFGEPALPDTEAEIEASIHDYYKDCGLDFDILDKQEVYEVAEEKLTGREIKNMVVDFGRESSWVAQDVPTEKAEALLNSWDETKRPKELGTRWIAIFDMHEQGDFLNKILLKYGLSTRLRATMLSPPGRGNLEIAQKVWHWSTVEYSPQFLAVGFNMLHNTVSRKILKRAREDFHDAAVLEEAARISSQVAREDGMGWLKNLFQKKESPSNSTILPYAHSQASGSGGSQAEKASGASTNPQGLFSVIYKRMTTLGKQPAEDDDDFETVREALRRQFSSRPKNKKGKGAARRSDNLRGDTDSLDDEMSLNQDYDDDEYDDVFECNEAEENYNDLHYNPHMLRLWIWLIMTHDGTVISIHEPIPQMKKDITNPRDIKDTVSHIRRNIRVVFRCLSKAGLAKKKSGSNDVEVAMEQGALVVRRAFGQARDLLFYYLFDDWYASWSLAVDRAHPYSKELNEIRGEDPMLDHIDKLHDIARRLASLKRVYSSYELILDRLLENKAYFRDPDNKCFSILSMNRFERLKHRISQLAVSEIEDCEKEANGLISLTYNRLNWRETKAVERLSLLSVALAKVTIVFLPLSIIMAYFGMNDVEGISGVYDYRSFWGAAGVALGLTFVFLYFVGGLGSTFEDIGRWDILRRVTKSKRKVKRRLGYWRNSAKGRSN
ncbi:hypothetical protein H072_10367 [Dactylellina haptotyla CBS 200.50]|uniref:Uncharacterized protein n=1 Tax=Dactylellina haptotyla (strain CBS 200.50) TaxID=1284197 RepID=S8A4U0_DACHA|nr:hypothetical protein H072_10367 [Dactylellina haptotyla CBS 200.50]